MNKTAITRAYNRLHRITKPYIGFHWWGGENWWDDGEGFMCTVTIPGDRIQIQNQIFGPEELIGMLERDEISAAGWVYAYHFFTEKDGNEGVIEAIKNRWELKKQYSAWLQSLSTQKSEEKDVEKPTS